MQFHLLRYIILVNDSSVGVDEDFPHVSQDGLLEFG